MFNFKYKRTLCRLQKSRDRVDRLFKKDLLAAKGEKKQEIYSQAGFEYSMAQEEIDELMSDHIRNLAERYDVTLPKGEEGEFWERMHIVGERLILTRLGREVTVEKILQRKTHYREAWVSILNLVITLGSLIVAGLAIYFSK